GHSPITDQVTRRQAFDETSESGFISSAASPSATTGAFEYFYSRCDYRAVLLLRSAHLDLDSDSCRSHILSYFSRRGDVDSLSANMPVPNESRVWKGLNRPSKSYVITNVPSTDVASTGL